VELLLEVVFEREIEERAAGSCEFHCRGESAVDDGHVAYREMSVKVVDVADDIDTVGVA
jgi:hypothetical protein